ncbi:MAG: class I SAM-dependent methyltransferase [Bacteroidia bacterium]
MTLDFRHTTKNLELRNGIWYSKNATEVSFPEDGYDRCYQVEENSFWFKHRNNCIIETVKQFTPNGVIFDIGGGNGYVASGLEKASLETVLVEPGKEGVLNAKKRGLTNIVCSTLEDMQLNNESADAMGIFDVLEHIEDDFSFLKTLNKFLKNGGMLYITVPAFQFLWSREDVAAGHFRRYSLKTLEKVLNKAGFEKVYSTYIFSVAPVPVLLLRVLPSWLGLYKNPQDVAHQQQVHASKKGITDSVLEKIWKWELEKIKNKEMISTGGSCLFVARKKQ